jgi:DNA polymerase-3 subunit delta
VNLKPEGLARSLASGLQPLYLLAGAEPLLIQEMRDQIIRAARAQGFLERQVFEVDKFFNWDELAMAGIEQSLFASRKILDLRIPTGKPGIEGSKYFIDFAGRVDPDVLLLVSCGAWDGSSRSSKWASELARVGALIEVWPVKAAELPGWIAKRMQAAGLKADADAVRALAEFVEGNLLAAQQEIEKISLLNSGAQVTEEMIHAAVSNNARFDAFRLGECLMQGKAADCLRVVAGLQKAGEPIQAISGALIYQLLQLEAVRSALAHGDSEAAAFSRNRVYKMQQPLVRQAVRRIPARTLRAAFSALSCIDRQSKGQESGDPWQTLEQMLLQLALAGARKGGVPGPLSGPESETGSGRGRSSGRAMRP